MPREEVERRYEKLFGHGVISEDQRDEAKKDLDVMEANLRAAIKHKEVEQ